MTVTFLLLLWQSLLYLTISFISLLTSTCHICAKISIVLLVMFLMMLGFGSLADDHRLLSSDQPIENGMWASSKILVGLVFKLFYNLKVPRYSADTFGKYIYEGMHGAPCFFSVTNSVVTVTFQSMIAV